MLAEKSSVVRRVAEPMATGYSNICSVASDLPEVAVVDILDLLNQGTETVQNLDQAASLRESAEAFLAAYREFQGYTVMPASPHAERILGAAMMLQPDLQAGTSGRAVVVFDVTVASGTLMARAARRVRDAGNFERIVGIALHCLTETHTSCAPAELNQLIVVDCDLALSLTCWKATERSNHGLVLAG